MSALAWLSGVALVVVCAALGRVPNLALAPTRFLWLFSAAFACYALAAWLLRHARGTAVVVIVLVIAAFTRLALLPAAPSLSTDAYRYLWDARVARAGISPYAHPPVAHELATLRDENIFPRLNHPTWRTIYPPAAELFFSAVGWVAPDSMLALKVALGIAELTALGALFGLLRALELPEGRLVIYAWNPLLLVEVWGTAHLDALVLPAVIGATWAFVAGHRVLAAGLLAAGASIKLYPAALLPLILGGPGSVAALASFIAVMAASYAHVIGERVSVLGSLPRYLQDEYFNPGITRSLADSPYLVIGVLIAWIAGGAIARRSAPFPHRAVMLVGGLIVLSGNVFPWYVLWLIPFLTLVPSIPWIAFTGSVAFAYAFFLEQPWAIPWWARAIECAPLAAGTAWWAARNTVLRPTSRRTT
jgi:alpha-1,6-mannosyltransferase